MKAFRTAVVCGALVSLCVFTGARAAQQRVNPNSNTERGGVEVKQVAGRKIGTITTNGDLVLLELDEGAVSSQNLFDLDKRTIRFTPRRPRCWRSSRASRLPGRATGPKSPVGPRRWKHE